MASLTRWTWVWASSRSWWWTGRPGMLQSVGSQRVWHDWATEVNWALFPNKVTSEAQGVRTWTNHFWERQFNPLHSPHRKPEISSTKKNSLDKEIKLIHRRPCRKIGRSSPHCGNHHSASPILNTDELNSAYRRERHWRKQRKLFCRVRMDIHSSSRREKPRNKKRMLLLKWEYLVDKKAFISSR